MCAQRQELLYARLLCVMLLVKVSSQHKLFKKRLFSFFKIYFQGRLNTGDHVALIYAPGVDLITAFYGCLYVGVVPVTIRPPHPQVNNKKQHTQNLLSDHLG